MPDYDFAIEISEDDDFKYYLQGILNKAHETTYPAMRQPKSRKYSIRVTDENGALVGGALIWIYWGWVDVSLLALQEAVRGRGLGRKLMAVIEDKARQENCTRLRTETFENELGFYQNMGYRIVGHLEDYPEGYDYYWLRKDLV